MTATNDYKKFHEVGYKQSETFAYWDAFLEGEKLNVMLISSYLFKPQQRPYHGFNLHS